jgi:hypothetical protein
LAESGTGEWATLDSNLLYNHREKHLSRQAAQQNAPQPMLDYCSSSTTGKFLPLVPDQSSSEWSAKQLPRPSSANAADSGWHSTAAAVETEFAISGASVAEVDAIPVQLSS